MAKVCSSFFIIGSRNRRSKIIFIDIYSPDISGIRGCTTIIKFLLTTDRPYADWNTGNNHSISRSRGILTELFSLVSSRYGSPCEIISIKGQFILQYQGFWWIIDG